MRHFLAAVCALVLLAAPARADVAEAVQETILPGYAGFAAASDALARAAEADCAPAALRPAYAAAFDAWMEVSHLRFGPAEDQGRSLAIAFWPDPKGSGARTMARMIAAEDPVVEDPARFAEVSIAARGLFALERLLYDPAITGTYACALTRATAADLARLASETETAWREFAPLLLTAGEPGNARFLSVTEARQVLFTQLMAGLEFTADQRLGRPLGTFDRPRPERAEARLSERSLRNVELSLAALERLALALAPDSPKTRAGFDAVRQMAAELDDPALAGVEKAQGRLKVEILQQRINALRDTVEGEVGPALKVSAGFNAADGD